MNTTIMIMVFVLCVSFLVMDDLGLLFTKKEGR